MTLNVDGNLAIWGIELSPWVFAPALFLLWVGIALVAWRFVSRWLNLRAVKRGSGPLAAVVQTLSTPLVIAIIVSGLWALERMLPLPAAVDHVINVVSRSLLVLMALVFVDRLVYRLLVVFKDRFAYIDITRGIVRGMLRLLILAVGLLVLFDMLGISITPLVASLGIGSLAVALALQGPLSNLFAGLFVLADRTVRVGDFVRLNTASGPPEEGYVTHIGWRHTRIRTLTNIAVIVPNSVLNSTVIENLNLPQAEISIFFPVGVSYASDLEHVERVTLEVASWVQANVTGAVRGFEPIVRYNAFADFSINFNVRLRTRDFDSTYLVKHEFIKALHRRYREEGIVIPFPIRTLDVPPGAAAALRGEPPREEN
ncbi:MAG: mechanosensitive ion channel family protein [bacterium]